MDHATPGQVVPSYVAKKAKQVMGIKQVSIILPWALHHVLPLIPALTSTYDGLYAV